MNYIKTIILLKNGIDIARLYGANVDIIHMSSIKILHLYDIHNIVIDSLYLQLDYNVNINSDIIEIDIDKMC